MSKVNVNENEVEEVSMNLFVVLLGPPRTGGRLESRVCCERTARGRDINKQV